MKKYISVAIAAFVLIGGYFASNAFINAKNDKPKVKAKERPATTVIVQKVSNTTIPIIVRASGSLMAKRRIEVFSEVQGVFYKTSKEFSQEYVTKKGKFYYKWMLPSNMPIYKRKKAPCIIRLR